MGSTAPTIAAPKRLSLEAFLCRVIHNPCGNGRRKYGFLFLFAGAVVSVVLVMIESEDKGVFIYDYFYVGIGCLLFYLFIEFVGCLCVLHSKVTSRFLIPLSYELSTSLSLSLLSLPLTHSLSFSLSPSHTTLHSLSLSFSLSHTLSLFLSLSLSLSLSLLSLSLHLSLVSALCQFIYLTPPLLVRFFPPSSGLQMQEEQIDLEVGTMRTEIRKGWEKGGDKQNKGGTAFALFIQVRRLLP